MFFVLKYACALWILWMQWNCMHMLYFFLVKIHIFHEIFKEEWEWTNLRILVLSFYVSFICLINSSFPPFSSLPSFSFHNVGRKYIFFYGWVIFHCIYVPHLLYWFICWGTFRLLPCLVNSTTMNIEVHVFFKLWFSLDICPGVRLLDHKVALFLLFQEASILFSTVVVLLYIPTNSVGEFPFLCTLSSIYCL